ncbi:MAG TPA: hypothetical protein VKF36_14775 [Syntrophorhabdales bacterium]|nr:hypothetical protein [Syntrophorhabdales bacterium]
MASKALSLSQINQAFAAAQKTPFVIDSIDGNVPSLSRQILTLSEEVKILYL